MWNLSDGESYWFYVVQPLNVLKIRCKLVKVINFIHIFKMLKCIELDERLKAMDQEITVNPQFVQKVIDLMSCEGM